MNQESGNEKKSPQEKRSLFNPTIVGCIAGLRLAAWTIEKTPGMVQIYREINKIQPPQLDSSKPPNLDISNDRMFKVVDYRDPDTGYVSARLTIRALAVELALKQIAQLSRDDGQGALNSHDLLKLWKDLPEKTRTLLEEGFQKNITVYDISLDNPQVISAKKPSLTIEQICEESRNLFIDARYITEVRPRSWKIMRDRDLKGILIFLTDWIHEKMGNAAASMPAEDAALQFKYMQRPWPPTD